jgi:hypothetical protein
MPSATAKKTAKPTPGSSAKTKRAPKRRMRSIKIYPLTGTLTEQRADEIIRTFGGRPMTKAEEKEFSRFFKDPYP